VVAARALGFAVPLLLVALADEVIEQGGHVGFEKVSRPAKGTPPPAALTKADI